MGELNNSLISVSLVVAVDAPQVFGQKQGQRIADEFSDL